MKILGKDGIVYILLAMIIAILTPILAGLVMLIYSLIYYPVLQIYKFFRKKK